MRFGIVGGGPAALAILDRIVQDVEEGKLSKDASITIFEKSGEFGRGMPYSKNLNHEDLRLNIAAVEPGISDDGEAFHKWLSTKSPLELKRMGIQVDAEGKVPEDGCYSRAMAMGAYLENYGQQLVEKAKALGLNVNVRLNAEVVDIDDTLGNKYVKVNNGKALEQHKFDGVYLALGHWSEKDPPRPTDPAEPLVMNSPWPAKKINEQIPQGSITGVIGTGPTAADTAIMLGHHNGTFTRNDAGELVFTANQGAETFKTIMASKSGLLPQLRGPIDMAEYVTEDDFLKLRDPKTGYLPLDGMFGIFREDMKSRYPDFAATIPNLDKMTFAQFAKWLEDDFAKKGGGDAAFKDSMKESAAANADGAPLPLQDVFINLYVFSEIHKYMSAEDKMTFHNRIKPIIAKVAAPLPPEIAEKLEAMMKAGALEVRKVDARDPMGGLKGEVHSIINAIGQSGDMKKHPSTLVQNLLKKGLMSEERVPFANNDIDHVADFVTRNGLEKKHIKEGDQHFINIGGVAVTDNYEMKNSNGKTVKGLWYVGPNNPRVFDSYSLIFSRDASHLVTESVQKNWNYSAGLKSVAERAEKADLNQRLARVAEHLAPPKSRL